MLREPILGELLIEDISRLTDTLKDDTIEGTVALGTEDQVTNIMIGLNTERAKENPERNVRLDARHGCLQ